MRYVRAAAITIAILAAVTPWSLPGQTAGLSIPPSPASYQLVSQTYVSRSQSYFTYQALAVNSGPAVASATATGTSLSSAIAVVAGQGTLHFGPVPANGATLSSNTFTIFATGGGLPDLTQLSWAFNGPTANPGSNQTVPVLSTVTLNGGGSTNPGGIGALTYSWSVQSAPSGSSATISNANSVIATFTPDLAGNYVIALTVSNGSIADTETVTISTTDAPPIANAGANQTVQPGSTVTLNGTSSIDFNTQPLNYLWNFVSIPAGSVARISGQRSPVANFVVDQPGTYIVSLTVNDGTLSSSPATTAITTGNTPPVAAATATPQNPGTGQLVQLDGSKSTDVDGNPLTYSWSLNTSQAPGSHATLSNPNIVNPTFTADAAGSYVAQLIVTDGTVASQPATVTVTTGSTGPPTANAGPGQKIVVGAVVQLQGSGTDPGNLPLTYAWSLMAPQGSKAMLSATNIPDPTFTADLPGSYTAQLVVNDGILSSSPAVVTITSTNVPPVAVPTTTTPSVAPGSTVLLSGSSSYDPDNQAITAYSWSLSVPPGSRASLSGANSEFPSFVPDVSGTYVAQLIVQDQFASSTPATVSISAGQMTITMTPNPLFMSPIEAPQTLTIAFSPAPSAPVNVSLSGYDSTVISPWSNTIAVPANATAVNALIGPVAEGSTTLTANAPGYQSATVSVTVGTPTLTITFSNNATSVGVNQSISGTVTLSAPAPTPSGTTVTLTDIVDHDAGNMPGLVTFNPSIILIPPGATTGAFTVTGSAVGPIEIRSNAVGYTRAPITILVVTP